MTSFSNQGSVRVVSKRKGGSPARVFETVVSIDRSDPILGNPHVLHNYLDVEERRRVINAYRQDLENDERVNGPMTQAIQRLADRVASGERLALACWCAPRECHGHVIQQRIQNIIEAKAKNDVNEAKNVSDISGNNDIGGGSIDNDQPVTPRRMKP